MTVDYLSNIQNASSKKDARLPLFAFLATDKNILGIS